MTDYCTRAEVRTYKGIGANNTADDDLIDDLIGRASQRIDTYCRRTFVARTSETRYFDALRDVRGRMLFLDDDLQAVTTLTNGDDSEISSDSYVLLPTNVTPKYAIKLKQSSSISWTYSNDPEEAISVLGTWGFNNTTTPPEDIKHAAVRLSAWYYDQRKAPFGTQAVPELGVIEVTPDVPADVRSILDNYVREIVG